MPIFISFCKIIFVLEIIMQNDDYIINLLFKYLQNIIIQLFLILGPLFLFLQYGHMN